VWALLFKADEICRTSDSVVGSKGGFRTFEADELPSSHTVALIIDFGKTMEDVSSVL